MATTIVRIKNFLKSTFTLTSESEISIQPVRPAFVPNLLSRRAILLGSFAMLAAPMKVWAQQTETVAALAPRIDLKGKLATRTGIVSSQNEAAMITAASPDAMQGAISMYEEIVAGGGWKTLPKGKLEKAAKSPTVVALRERLVREGYLDIDTLSVAKPEVYDGQIIGAIRAFQINHGIAPSGKVDNRTRAELDVPAAHRLFQLTENQVRVATYSKDLGERNILVNIPSTQLETVENGKVYARHNIVVGKVSRPTPSLVSKVTDVTFNPYWNAPASIVAKDIIPKYLKDPSYLDQMHIRVFDGVGGPEIDPTSVDWENTAADRFHFRQEPGAHNSLATVKVNFANEFMVYMHDTPHRELFQQNSRFESSGCVRVDNVRMFIDWILAGQDGFNEAQFEMITASEETYVMPVRRQADVRFMYLTAWATEDGRVNFRPDIYNLDGTGFVLGQPEGVEEI
jgi:L,D-transpeptidase YcbB